MDDKADALIARAASMGANLRKAWDDYVCISLDETTTRSDIELLWTIFGGDDAKLPNIDQLDADAPSLIPEELKRTSDFLTHPVAASTRAGWPRSWPKAVMLRIS